MTTDAVHRVARTTDRDVANIRELLERHDRHTTELSDGVTSVDVQHYVDADLYRREVDLVFRRLPQPVAHLSQLRSPGDYVTDCPLGTPVLVMRQPDGGVRAFLNVCRHRGAQLTTQRSGRVRQRLSCPYHGWSYGIDGELCVVPDRAQAFPELDQSTRGLVPLESEVAAGWVWAPLDPAGTAGLISSSRDDPELRSESFVLYEETIQQRRFNWKLGVEGFLENYHFAYLHRRSTHPIFLHNLALFEPRGRDIRAVAPKRSILDLKDFDVDRWSLAPHATVLHVLFPSTCVFVEQDHHSVVRIRPTGPETSEVCISHVVRHDQLSLRHLWDRNVDIFMSAVDEDLDICESIQAGVRSGANQQVLFGRNEPALQWFRAALHEVMSSQGQTTRGDGDAGDGDASDGDRRGSEA